MPPGSPGRRWEIQPPAGRSATAGEAPSTWPLRAASRRRPVWPSARPKATGQARVGKTVSSSVFSVFLVAVSDWLRCGSSKKILRLVLLQAAQLAFVVANVMGDRVCRLARPPRLDLVDHHRMFGKGDGETAGARQAEPA